MFTKIRTLAVAMAVCTLSSNSVYSEDIVDIAVEAGIFNSLILAATAGGLANELKSDGPFTVYAPTDDAFAALPEGTVATLLKPENRAQLVSILLYHVDDRNMPSSAIGGKITPVKTMNTGSRLCMSWNKSGVLTIGDSTDTKANVIQADIKADNGRIHVIDKVLIPGNRHC